jgi:transketolase
MTLDPLDKRLYAFGMRVFIVPGHDLKKLAAPADEAVDGRPLVVLAETNPSQGLPLLAANAPKFHYTRFKTPEDKARYERALKELD